MRRLVIMAAVLMLALAYGSASAKPPQLPIPVPVTVENETTDPVNVNVVNSAATEPVQHDISSDGFTVPSDRSLVIKHVSGHVSMTEGFHILRFAIRSGPADNRVKTHVVPVMLGNSNGFDYFTFSQQTYIVAPPDSTVSWSATTSNPSFESVDVVISGDLLPFP